MCLAVVALDAHPAYALVVAANRDEFHDRPAAPAAWWDEGWLAGRDLAAGGTWLGATRAGRFAFLTNLREPARHDPAAPSRGALVTAVLADPRPLPDALAAVRAASDAHNGYNLCSGDASQLAWTSNRTTGVRALARGVHGVSNGLIDDAWPKTRRMAAAMRAWIAGGGADLAPLFAALADRSVAPDAELPSTGVALDWERALSAVFIAGERYGTRCSTVYAIDRAGGATFIERSFRPGGAPAGEVIERYRLGSGRAMTTCGIPASSKGSPTTA